MAGAIDSRTWSVQKDWDRAELFFELPNFHAVKRMKSTGHSVTSKQISIGRSSFCVLIYPSGENAAEAGNVGVFLQNCSKYPVVVDYIATVGITTKTARDVQIENGIGNGWKTFMKAADVMIGANFVLSMDIKLKKEEINGSIGEAVNKSFISIKEVEGGVENVIENRLRVHAAELRGCMVDSEGRLDRIVRDIVEGVEGEVKQAAKRLKTEMEGHIEEVRGCFRDTEVGLRTVRVDVRGAVEDLEGKMDETKRELRVEIGKVKAPATDFIPECLVCLETLGSLKIVQCMQGHKICEPCSEKEEVVACPDCKLAFLGRDMGMETFVRGISVGSPVRKKEDLLMEKMNMVAEELKADFLREIGNVKKDLKAEIAKVKTPAVGYIPECPICLHQMTPPTKIVHCVKGHKLCETCSKKEAVKSCPSCKTAFMGRDFGMEAFIRELAGEK